MVILNGSKPECTVGEFYGCLGIFGKTGHRTDCVHILDNDISFLVNCLEEAELVFIRIDRLLEDAVLVEISPLAAEVLGKFLKFSGTLDRRGLFDEAHTGMVPDKLDHSFAVHVFFCRDPDRVHMHHRRRDDHGHGRDGNMREHGLDIGAVVAGDGHRVKDHRIDWPFLDLAGVGSPADHDRMDVGDTELLVNLVDNPAKAGGVAGDDPDKLPADCIGKVTGRVEGEPGNLVLLATLPERLFPEFLVERLVGRPHIAGGCIHNHVGRLAHVFDRAGNRKAGFLKRGLLREIGNIEGISPLFCDEGLGVWAGLGDADHFHILLGCNRIGNAFPDGTVPVDSNLDHMMELYERDEIKVACHGQEFWDALICPLTESRGKFYKNSAWNFTTSVLSLAVAYSSSGSLLTSRNLIPQLTQPRISAARSCSPRIKSEAAIASMEVSLQGLPKLTGFAAIRKGKARRILHEQTAPVSSTSQEPSRAVMDFTNLSAGESACSAVGSSRRVFLGIWEIFLTIRIKPARSSFFTVHLWGSQLLSR